MADLTIQFEEVPTIWLGTMTAGGVDGAIDINFGLSRSDWKVESVRLNTWDAVNRERGYVTLRDSNPIQEDTFFRIANAVMIHPVYGEMIDRAVAAHWGQKGSAYDRARDAREAA